VWQSRCLAPSDFRGPYQAPVHAVIGMAGRVRGKGVERGGWCVLGGVREGADDGFSALVLARFLPNSWEGKPR
jgi:hypothetical protein